MKQIFTDDLPKKGTLISWKDSIGYQVPFKYENIEGILRIINYQDKVLYVKYSDKDILKITVANFIGCKFGNYVGYKREVSYKYSINETVIGENINKTIIDRYYIKDKNNYNVKMYIYKCNICGADRLEGTEVSIKKSQCLCCTNKLAVLGINTVYDTNPNLIELGIPVEYAKKYTKCSSVIVPVTCPYCGRHKEISMLKIYRNQSIQCICGDGLSYPEKIMFSVLTQICEDDFEYHKRFSWSENKEYDFYLPKTNIVIETHGKQHYSYTGRGRGLSDEQENDRFKKQLAINNNIEEEKDIVIDCRESKLKYIKNNILKSYLGNFLNLELVDWERCEKDANTNLLSEICNLWNSGQFQSTTQLAKYKKITNIRKYLVIGNELGLTKYDAQEEARKVIISNSNRNKKEVQVYKGGNLLGTYESSAYISKHSEELFGIFLYASEITRVCNGIKETYKGYTFRHTTKNVPRQNRRSIQGQPIIVFKEGVFVAQYPSCNELARSSQKDFGMSFNAGKISMVCNGKRKSHKGYVFKYL